jgi:hypothetical protein
MPKPREAYTEATVSRNPIVVIILSILVPASLGAQATTTMKVSATVVAPQTVAPQASAASLADMVSEQVQNGEQVTSQALDAMNAEQAWVSVSMDVVERPDLTTPMGDQRVHERQTLQVTVAYSGN